MPLFMLLSGFVSYKTNYDLYWLQRKSLQLLIPYFGGTFLMACTLKEGSFCDYFLYPLKGLWFLWVLYVLSVCQYIIASIGRRKLWVIGLLFIILSAFSIKLKSLLSFDLIAFHFIFYFTGSYMRKYWVILKHLNLYALIVCVIGACFLAITFDKDIPSYFPLNSLSLYLRVVPLFISMSLFILSSRILSFWNGPMTFVGTNTLCIYLLHRVMLEYVPYTLIVFPGTISNNLHISSYYWYVVLLFVCITLFCIYLSCLFSKNRILSLMFCGK